ncbi:MAG: alpha/beta fold hydrolase, partial [Bacteroidota bacterium]
MKLKRTSYFKDQQAGATAMQAWVSRLEATNVRSYTTQTVETALGQTVVYSLHTEHKNRPAFVIFPGFRTSSLYWDLDKGLDQLGDRFRIYMVETNGQPNLSDGHTPDIRGLDYGTWAGQIFEGLGLEAAYVAGASFGGLVALKMAIVHPGKIKACFLLASGGLQAFNFSFRNLYLNLLPVFSPKPKNIRKFLDRVVFHPP